MASSLVLCAIPSMAQIANSVTFDAPSDFYVGNAKTPAGSYRVTQPEPDDNLLSIEDGSGSHWAFVECVIAHPETPHASERCRFQQIRQRRVSECHLGRRTEIRDADFALEGGTKMRPKLRPLKNTRCPPRALATVVTKPAPLARFR